MSGAANHGRGTPQILPNVQAIVHELVQENSKLKVEMYSLKFQLLAYGATFGSE